MSKSPNKHNRLYVTASPLGMPLSDAIESGKCGPKTETKERSKMLVEEYEWEKNDT